MEGARISQEGYCNRRRCPEHWPDPAFEPGGTSNQGSVARSRTLCRARRLAALFLLAPCWAAAAGDELSICATGSVKELGRAMEAHNQHVYRMNRKFKDVWYFQGAVPAGVGKEVTFESVHGYLARLAPRRAALLFHAAGQNRLCTWLIMQDRSVVRHQQHLSGDALAALSPAQWQELGVRSARKPRVGEPGAPIAPLDPEESKRRWDALLARLSGILLPPPVAERLVGERIDTLIVVPISIRSGQYPREGENDTATHLQGGQKIGTLPAGTQLVLTVGTVPFLALPVGGRPLVERASVIVAPGFLPFAGEPDPPRAGIEAPLVVGAPIRKGLEPLPGARDEAVQIARDLATKAYVGEDARKRRVLDELAGRADALDFILLATHGRASEKNPVDESFLEFSDGRLNAREISLLRPEDGKTAERRRLARRPIVVMSACETGLGKDFAVGTIGLARAWQWAGASSVVMSLWSVDDAATRDLMVDLVAMLRTGTAVDRALREAAIAARRQNDNPALWAAFSVFGAPERARSK